MEFNYRGVGFLITLCLILVSIEFIVMDVTADSNSTESYVLVDYNDTVDKQPFSENESGAYVIQPSIVSGFLRFGDAYKNNTRISQGQCIEIGGTYDVSGVIGFSTEIDYNAFSYYTRYEDAFDPRDNSSASYIMKMPNARIGYYQFFVDPIIFSERLGYWYQFTNTYERAANKRAFYVSDKCIRSIDETEVLDVNNNPVLLNPRHIEPRHASDILLSLDDPLMFNVSESQLWLFGDSTKILSMEVNASKETEILFSPDIIKKWGVSTYKLLLQEHGTNGVYELKYALNTRNTDDRDTLVPTFRAFDIIDVTGYQPKMIYEKVVDFLNLNTDDKYSVYDMELQVPHIEISGYQELRYDNASLLEVTGYTNKIPGTPITIYIDRTNTTLKSTKYPAMTTITENGSIGDYRTFHGYFPLYYDQIFPGFHELTAVLPDGKSASVDFYIREEPLPHYEQPKYFKFVDGNPFYEPVIIEKEIIKEVTKEVIKEVIIKEPVDYEKLAQEKNRQTYDDIWKALPIAIGGLSGLILSMYIISVLLRAYERRKETLVKTESKGENK